VARRPTSARHPGEPGTDLGSTRFKTELHIACIRVTGLRGGKQMGLNETGLSLLQFFQGLAVIAAAIAFAVGGFYFIFGGDRGRSKAVSWLVGGAVGLIIVMGAFTLAEMVNDNIKF